MNTDYYQPEQSYIPPPPTYPSSALGVTPPGHDATIASMRWESDPLVHKLLKIIGGYEARYKQDGTVEYYRVNQNVKPLINDLGLRNMIGIINATYNPAVSLTNIDDEEANELIRQILYAIIRDLAYNGQLYEVTEGDKYVIMNLLKPIIYAQVKRCVAGHESNNFHTQTLEHNVQQHIQQPNQGGGSLLPWRWGRK